MSNINELNKQFGLPGKLSFDLLADDMPVAILTTGLCSARISMQGAQILEWAPLGQRPVVWLSQGARFVAGQSIRGGVPVCWPWFGAHASNPEFPAHGYARTVPWTISDCVETENGTIRLTFVMQNDNSKQQMWPYNTLLELHMSFSESLELELITRNVDKQSISITEALHTYFAVSDIRQVRVTGLDNCQYLDKVQDFTAFTQQGEIGFGGEVDRVYLDTESECIIDDSAWQRRIHINKKGSRSTVVWNPWMERAAEMGDMGKDGYLSMLCVESANAASNLVTIEPGAEHRLLVRYHID